MKESGEFKLGDPVKLVGRDNPYASRKGLFIEYRRTNFQETRIVVLVEGIEQDNRTDWKESFFQGDVELDEKTKGVVA